MKKKRRGLKVENPFFRIIYFLSFILIVLGFCITILFTVFSFIIPTIGEGFVIYKPNPLMFWLMSGISLVGYVKGRFSEGKGSGILIMFGITLLSWVMFLLLLHQCIKLEFKEDSYRTRSFFTERDIPSFENPELVLSKKRSKSEYISLDMIFLDKHKDFQITRVHSLFGDLTETCLEQKEALKSAGMRVKTFCTEKE